MAERHDGRQIVPKSWIDACLTPSIHLPDGLGYSRALVFSATRRCPPSAGKRRWAGGFGNGGQRLFICPEAGTATVAYLGLYNDWSSWIVPTRFWREDGAVESRSGLRASDQLTTSPSTRASESAGRAGRALFAECRYI